jgi:ABC-2 type transport system ATP-binding protein
MGVELRTEEMARDGGRTAAMLAGAGQIDVQLAGAGRRFGGVVALSQVDMQVRAGTILGIVGPSGAGKTTCLRLITGALKPSAGRVRVLNEDPTRHSRGVRGRIGYMPQQLALLPELTASENVNLAASVAGLTWPIRGGRVANALKLVDLYQVRNRQARHLSGGMQRRVELASALVHDPYLLILDEPTAGIDPILRERIWTELHRLRDAARTIIVTTQYVAEAEYCDVVALIAGGRVAAMGTPLELRRLASGGDVIQVQTSANFDGRLLTNVPGVRRVRQTGFGEFEVVVDDAGSATPTVVKAVTDAGSDVVSTREWRPTFDQVFTDLVQPTAPQTEARE